MNNFILSLIASCMVLSSSALMAGGPVTSATEKLKNGEAINITESYKQPDNKYKPGSKSRKWLNPNFKPNTPKGGRSENPSINRSY